MHARSVILVLQYLSQATILAHIVLFCAYTVTSHDTFTRCASVLVLVHVTGHDTTRNVLVCTYTSDKSCIKFACTCHGSRYLHPESPPVPPPPPL